MFNYVLVSAWQVTPGKIGNAVTALHCQVNSTDEETNLTVSYYYNGECFQATNTLYDRPLDIGEVEGEILEVIMSDVIANNLFKVWQGIIG